MGEIAKSQKTPTQWWQWILMYPTLGITMLGAIPTFNTLAQSYVKDVPFDTVAIVNQDDELWKKNAKCFKENEYTGITTRNNVRVEVLVCPNGDILAKVEKPNGDEQYKWIGLHRFGRDTALLDGFIGQAYAKEPSPRLLLAQAGNQVLCKTFIGQGRIKRTIRTSNGRCVEEIVNTRTGRVLSSRSIACSSGC